MKPDPMLDAIFQPDEETLVPVLAAARRRRVRRKLTPLGAAVVFMLAASLLVLRQAPEPVLHVPTAVAKPVIEKIETRPLSPKEIVRTVSSSITVVTTASAKAAPVQIAEADLLAQFDSGHVALVGSGPERRLIEF